MESSGSNNTRDSLKGLTKTVYGYKKLARKMRGCKSDCKCSKGKD